jgi:hypothetical protein
MERKPTIGHHHIEALVKCMFWEMIIPRLKGFTAIPAEWLWRLNSQYIRCP